MAKISNKDTLPEVTVRKFLFSKGFRFRKNVKELPGKPDIVLCKYKTVIFINGCFWHGHSCKRATIPKTNYSFWEEKINGNKARDIEHSMAIERMGWHIITIWQCEILRKKQREDMFNVLLGELFALKT